MSEAEAKTSSIERVRAALAASGLALEVVELEASTRTAQEAADSIGCTVAQIVKSLVFRGKTSGKALLVLASGANRVDETRMAQTAGEPLGRADAGFVRAETGFAIGGVAPVGHIKALKTFIDRDLRQYEEIWAAAGKPNAVFRLTPADLVALTRGSVVQVC
ncbi:YbaK/EbsC family protein [Salaquimonas pukyongi]|uniref:YbaK/EbsC family protein n=1 Tax=Salaquimonas pukyongi TaxID=2712698 RepID=UPI00096BC82B|nr:YbaK/EbsC family protein [Salaquimonas pukyongi]